MELPAEVLVHNETINVKGARGSLLNISEHGFFEMNLKFGDKTHRVLLPVATTVVIQRDAEEDRDAGIEIER